MDATTRYWRVGWFWIVLLCSSQLHALQVGVLVPQSAPAVAQLVHLLEQQLEQPVVVIHSLDDERVAHVDFWVLAGEAAQQHAMALAQPSVSVFISRAQWQAENGQQHSAIYVEPPLQRQVNLARLLFGERQSFGILAAEQAVGLSTVEWTEQARVSTYFVDQYDSLNQALTQLLRRHVAVIGDYDVALFSAENIKTILITAYRHNKPLIGPSSAYLRAGALASTFSDVEHIAQRLEDMIRQYQKDKVLLPADYNPYFHVRFNEQVARSLNIPLPDVEAAQRYLQGKESQP